MVFRGAGKRYSYLESVEWLDERLLKLKIASVAEFATEVGMDRGTISRYFRQERPPSIDAIAPLCKVLQVSPETLLIVLGAIDKKN